MTIQRYYKDHGGPTAYLGTTVPGLPNFYLISGALSIHLTLQSQSPNALH